MVFLVPNVNKNKMSSLFSTMSLQKSGDTIRKRLTYSADITSSGGGAISVASLDTNLTQSTTEFSSFSARYQAYRVVAMKARFIALHPTVDATANIHGTLVVGDSLVGNTPGNAGQLLSDERSSIYPTWKSVTAFADWNLNPNAKLWDSTGSNIPTANRFAINYGSPSTLTNGITYYHLVIEFIVEFRGSQ